MNQTTDGQRSGKGMKTKTELPPKTLPDSSDIPAESERDQISQNIEAVLEFYAREDQKISYSQRIMERISRFIGQPVFLGIILLFVSLWILANVALRQSACQNSIRSRIFGCKGLSSGRAAYLDRGSVQAEPVRQTRRTAAHLDLKVNLLTEQKTTKLIDLLEELRRDLPM